MPLTSIESQQLGPSSAGLRMSFEEFESHDDFEEGYRFELIHGVLIVTPPPANSEVSSNQTLGYLLQRYRDDNPLGKCIDDTLPEQEIKTKVCLRRADRAIWIGLGRDPIPKQDIPAIVIEFVSPGKAAFYRDYEHKRDEYLEVGCQEYWVIDRFDRTMTIFRDRKVAPEVVTEQQTFKTSLLPGFELPLKGILAAGDRYTK